MSKTTLVTGAAGFIGSAACLALLARGDRVIGIDNLSDYYDVALKQARLRRIQGSAASDASGSGSCGSGFSRETPSPQNCGSGFSRENFHFQKLDIADQRAMQALFQEHPIDQVVHLAAQPGVRYSIDHPRAYVESNISGFLNVLEGARHHEIEHLVYASSSSVYGANEKMPFSEEHNVDHPFSLYAASKKSNELMAHAYAHLYGLPATGLRFFTVYGPWGRPDMAPMKFARAILADEPIDLYNYGEHRRDFTYIDDIVEGMLRVLDQPAQPDAGWYGVQPNPATSRAPWRIYNIGAHEPVELAEFIAMLEKALGKTARKNPLPLQPGDVPDTYASVEKLEQATGYRPRTTLEEGIGKFVAWYRDYYG